jgi:hypothetical protein
MVAKDDNGNPTKVPDLELKNFDEVRRFFDAVRRINQKKKLKTLEEKFDYQSAEDLKLLENYNVKIKL